MFLDHLKNKRIILASRSPRRQQLLAELGIQFEILLKEEMEEVFPDSLQGVEIPRYLAELKSKAYENEIARNALVITADTIVWVDNQVLGKPADRQDAIRILNQLSGKMHTVFTGVCLRSKEKQLCLDARTDVFFKPLSIDEITYYIDAFKPFAKAGAYGIQEWIGYAAVERIEGSYFNVMGLPIHQLYEELRKF